MGFRRRSRAGLVWPWAMAAASCAGREPATPADAGAEVKVAPADASDERPPPDGGPEVAVDRPDAAADVVVEAGIDAGDGGADAAEATADATDAGLGDAAGDGPAAVDCTIAGGGPMALHLVGRGLSVREWPPSSGPEFVEELDLYLPSGRVAGAQALLAFDVTWGPPGLAVLEGTLDVGLSTAPFRFDGVRFSNVTYSGHLVGPAGPLLLDVTRNLNVSTDVLDFASARLALCPAGAAPEPRVAPGAAILPTDAIELLPAVPLATTSGAPRLRVGGEPAEAAVRVTRGLVTVTPARHMPPNASVEVDVGALRDVMGRAVPLAGELRVLTTTAAAVSDRTFAAAPPAGAVASSVGWGVRDGVLRPALGAHGPYRMLVALGEFAGARRVTVRYALGCASPSDLLVWLVAANGSSVRVPLVEDRSVTQATVEAPGTGPLWLAVESTAPPNRPGWGVPRIACPLGIDEVAAAP